MQVNVAQLLKETIGSTRSYEISEFRDVADDGRVSLVQGNITLTRTDRGILARGTLHTAVKIECSRCLSLYDCPLTVNIEEEFFPTIDIISGTPLPLPEEPSAFPIDEQHILDLSEAIRQNVILAIPMKQLCHEDCAGLCPKCGHNLNEGACDCPSQEIDPRWAKLLKLIGQ